MVRSERYHHVISKTLDFRESPSSSTKVLAQFSPYDHVALFYHAVDVGCYNAQVNGQKGGVDISVKKKLFSPWLIQNQADVAGWDSAVLLKGGACSHYG